MNVAGRFVRIALVLAPLTIAGCSASPSASDSVTKSRATSFAPRTRASRSSGVTIGLLAPRIRPKENCVEVDAPIEACAARPENGARVLARACDANQPCRDDFTCVRVENEKGGALAPMGACVPPYFVYQMRVDGPRLDRL